MSTDIVKISNKAYSISQAIADRVRRRKYFMSYTKDSPNKLTADESKLLHDLGLEKDSNMITALKLYLPTFFDNLQMCSSDTSMILRKNCNIPYYVLWSIMIANKQATDERLRENRLKESSHQLGVAMNTATIHQLRPKLDEYDDLFQLIVINPVSPPIPFRLFQMNNAGADPAPAVGLATPPAPATGLTPPAPAIGLTTPAHATGLVTPVAAAGRGPKPGPNPGPKHGPRKPDDRETAINKMFTLFLIHKTRPKTGSVEGIGLGGAPVHGTNSTETNNTEEIYKQILEFDKTRYPLYTFTQKGSTCASDALFTILLQADLIKRIFINNANQIISNKLDKALIHAIKRYINMLELESKQTNDHRVRRASINLTEKHGEQILKTMSESECSIGLTRTQITKYLTDLRAKLLPTIPTIQNLFFFGGGDFKTNIDNMTIGKKNLNNIQGFLITHAESTTEIKTGHAIAILKINNNWYISNNEIGLLELIFDQTFIPILLYKLYNTTSNTDEIFQLHTQSDKRYIFRFTNGYRYPLSGTPSDNVSIVDAKRILVFGENSENIENTQLTNIYINFNKNEAEFIGYLNSLFARSAAGAAASAGAGSGGIFGNDNNW